jgi:hypothetical protein
MATFSRDDELRDATFVRADLRGARFVGADLEGAVLRGVDVSGVEIDSPWLFDDGATLLVNGVDVVPLVDAELDRRFPGRAGRRATDPAGLRAAWAALQGTWAAAVDRVATLPAGAADVSVAGEWSFAQTLRHLVMATDTWLGRAVLARDQPYHPLGLPDAAAGRAGLDLSIFTPGTPPYGAVLAARADRVAMVGDFLATVTPAELAADRPDPWLPSRRLPVLDCLHVLLGEEWEHLRYAIRDLDALAAAPGPAA